jgi:hypothetical protein
MTHFSDDSHTQELLDGLLELVRKQKQERELEKRTIELKIERARLEQDIFGRKLASISPVEGKNKTLYRNTRKVMALLANGGPSRPARSRTRFKPYAKLEGGNE